MTRTTVIAVLCCGLTTACVTVPGPESRVSSWSNGVVITQRQVTEWSGASPFERDEAWVRNTSTSIQCLALKASNAAGYVQTWTLAPGTNEVMFPQLSKYSRQRYIPGRYGSWTPISGSCDAPPANLPLTTIGES